MRIKCRISCDATIRIGSPKSQPSPGFKWQGGKQSTRTSITVPTPWQSEELQGGSKCPIARDFDLFGKSETSWI